MHFQCKRKLISEHSTVDFHTPLDLNCARDVQSTTGHDVRQGRTSTTVITKCLWIAQPRKEVCFTVTHQLSIVALTEQNLDRHKKNHTVQKMRKMAIAGTLFFRAVGGGRTRDHRREKKKRKVEVTDKKRSQK